MWSRERAGKGQGKSIPGRGNRMGKSFEVNGEQRESQAGMAGAQSQG